MALASWAFVTLRQPGSAHAGPDPARPLICAALNQIPEIILALAQPDLGKREHCPAVPRAAMFRIRLAQLNCYGARPAGPLPHNTTYTKPLIPQPEERSIQKGDPLPQGRQIILAPAQLGRSCARPAGLVAELRQQQQLPLFISPITTNRGSTPAGLVRQQPRSRFDKSQCFP